MSAYGLDGLERALDRLEDAIESKAADTPDASRSPRGPLAVVASSVPLRGSTADVLLFRSKTPNKATHNPVMGSASDPLTK